MAVTVKGHTIEMTANTDVLDQATLGHTLTGTPTAANRPYKIRAAAIAINGAAGGAVTLKNGGSSGVSIFNITVAANSYTVISGSNPLELDDLALTAVTGATVIVYLAP